MNKFLLLGAASILSVGVNAQQAQRTPASSNPFQAPMKSGLVAETHNRTVSGTPLPAAKATAVTFWTEDFSSGTATSLPTGWTAAGNSSFTSTWKWSNAANTNPYFPRALNSTTASNGWMLFDTYLIGQTNPTALPIEGSLTSPSINCTGHSSVVLSFQQLYRRLNGDSFFVYVSSDNFATSTRFPLVANNSLPGNVVSSNPNTAILNISSAAANQANVKLRFFYSNNVDDGGAYTWQIDDVTLSEADPIDASLHNSSIVMRGTNKYTIASSYPRALVDSAWGITFSDNNGGTAVTPTYSYTVTRGGSVVFTNTMQEALPISAIDSLIDFSEPQQGFLPNVTGTYEAAFDMTIAGDATANDNKDTATLVISDSTLAVYDPKGATNSLYLHRPTSSTSGEASFFQGMQFEIAKAASGTVTSISTVFPSSSQPGGNVSVQLYKRGAQGYVLKGSTEVLPLTSSMISPASGGYVFAPFPMDVSGGPVVLDSGSYVAVVQIESVPANNTVTLLTTTSLNSKAIDFALYPGASDSSRNDGAFDFSPSSFRVGTTSPAVLRVNFAAPVGVKNTASNFNLGTARPNPAQSEFTVPVTLKAASNVVVTLTNPMGQVVATQNLGKVAAGQTTNAVFNTTALSNGVYFYTVEAGGERITNRVVVSH